MRDAIAPMKLGLWMSPTFFNPSSATFAAHPDWVCHPVGDALVAANVQDPEGGSNEAGLGPWGPAALPHVESRIREAIENWGTRYFKFDFLVWLDCLGGPDGVRDMYEFHDAFVALVDRLRADHPEVTFEIDETNDYRLFPFESVARGPSWFQNGGPDVAHMLHNLWNLSPFIPTFSLGQNALANEDFAGQGVDTLMAAAMLSHITFFHDPRTLPDAVIDRVGDWTAFYKSVARVARRRGVPAAGGSAGEELDRAAGVGPGEGRGCAARVPPGLRRGDEADRARERAGGEDVPAHVRAGRCGRRDRDVGGAAGRDRREHSAGQGREGAPDQARAMTRRLLVLGAVACALLAGVPAHAGAAVTVSTYSVPVTTPDSLGASVSLDTDVYVPDGTPPPTGFPLLDIFHGGGSTKDNGYDAAHARTFADNGYVVVSYSARGHGNSGGQTSVAGPAEIRDLFDVTAWALSHPDFHIDRTRIALSGYSQGGLHTNLGQVWSNDPSINPYGISFRALEPGNTPDLVFEALVPNSVLKLSYGVGLIGTYFGGSTQGKLAPVVDKWLATAAADAPQLYGSGDRCDRSTHDTATSTMQQDLAWRSVGCQPERLGLPWLWAQAFDDGLFTPHMAITMWRQAPNPDKHRLYLSMGGHAAPAADQSVEQDKLDTQRRFLDAVMKGQPLPGPNVVYWTRDPTVEVPAGSYAYPAGAWRRQTAGRWPPASVAERDVSPRRRRQRDAGFREQRDDLPLAAHGG